MGTSRPTQKKLQNWAQRRAEAIWTNLQTNHLWQRMLKNTLATTITVIIALLPAVVQVYGKAAYLGAITSVFGHPGRRFGMMAEALVLAISGTLLGIGWSMFGLYLSSLVYHTNSPAAYTIRGLFLAVALLFHGFLRSHTPRLFIFVLLLVIASVVSLTSVATEVSKTSVTQILYPILTASGVILLVNTCIFPEFSSSFLGITTIETLGATVGSLRDAGRYFIAIVEEPKEKSSEAQENAESENPAQSATAAEKVGVLAFNCFFSQLCRDYSNHLNDQNQRFWPGSFNADMLILYYRDNANFMILSSRRTNPKKMQHPLACTASCVCSGRLRMSLKKRPPKRPRRSSSNR